MSNRIFPKSVRMSHGLTSTHRRIPGRRGYLARDAMWRPSPDRSPPRFLPPPVMLLHPSDSFEFILKLAVEVLSMVMPGWMNMTEDSYSESFGEKEYDGLLSLSKVGPCLPSVSFWTWSHALPLPCHWRCWKRDNHQSLEDPRLPRPRQRIKTVLTRGRRAAQLIDVLVSTDSNCVRSDGCTSRGDPFPRG